MDDSICHDAWGDTRIPRVDSLQRFARDVPVRLSIEKPAVPQRSTTLDVRTRAGAPESRDCSWVMTSGRVWGSLICRLYPTRMISTRREPPLPGLTVSERVVPLARPHHSSPSDRSVKDCLPPAHRPSPRASTEPWDSRGDTR
jgi:hypothetical protein